VDEDLAFQELGEDRVRHEGFLGGALAGRVHGRSPRTMRAEISSITGIRSAVVGMR
jgi:hypothetical protein